MYSKNRIGILGVGAIGTVVACYLQANTSHELLYFSRTKKTNLKLTTVTSSYDITVGIETSPIKAPQLDWLIVCLKANQYEEAQHWFSKLISLKTKVAVIRNGLRLKEPLLNFTSGNNLLECSIDCPTEPAENGFYKTIRTPIITLPKSTLASEFQMLFTSEIVIHQVEDFKTESWKKLCESATIGAILCLHNDTCRIFKSEDRQQQFKELLKETIQVAIADGAKIESDFIDKMLSKLLSYPDTKGSSMLTDLRHGKPIELEAKNGIISQLGKQYQIETPINDLVIKLLS